MDSRSSNALSRELGDALRRARYRSTARFNAFAAEMGWSPGRLSKVERGTRGASEVDIARYVGHLHADQETYKHIMKLAQEQNTGHLVRSHEPAMPDDLRALLIHEQTAEVIWSYEIIAIPGLLQTADYARGLMRTPQGEYCVAQRMKRQKIFDKPQPPQGRFFIHEAALMRVSGGPQVMYEQMLQLLFRGGVRLVPFAVALPGSLDVPFTFMTFAEHAPVSYSNIGTAGVFSDSPDTTFGFYQCCEDLDRVALSEGESRSVFADWAGRYDRLREEQRESGGDAVA
ncbi:helix-turn-helix domain-containing protein [Saccharothrix syringae]|uniref:XRE family transcriptional regulator n=1 Tax=Saccharothrix syringae TaxID=103733 RepID=A0A5Q0H9X2_SACSY|nr:helix-turn-helix transcriptional regulator [Saccharothrix syringae]QFZ23048.1 XRE family transcriptional regulator [Saccharothrix syringae]